MNCPDCGQPLLEDSFLCGNDSCPFQKAMRPSGEPLGFKPLAGVEWSLIPDGCTIAFGYNGPNEGHVAFTYQEMLALLRVARAQLELEKKRGSKL